MSDVRDAIRRGHRTSHGRTVTVSWRNVTELAPGDVLASLQAANGRRDTVAILETALKARTWATVTGVTGDELATRVNVETRDQLRFSREWRNVANLPIIELVPTSENLSAS